MKDDSRPGAGQEGGRGREGRTRRDLYGGSGIELAKRLEGEGAGAGVGRIAVSLIGRFALKRLRDAGFDEPGSYEPAYFFLNTRSRTGSLSMMNPVTRF